MSDLDKFGVAMIHCGDSPHPVHQGFAEVVEADLYKVDSPSLFGPEGSIPSEIYNGFRLPNYDIYIAEGTRSLYGALAGQISKDSTLIYLAADQSLYELQNLEQQQSMLNRLISEYGMGLLKFYFNRYIDGVISVSDFIARSTTNILNVPTRVSNAYIQPDVFDSLGDISPSLDQNTAITIGAYEDYKGQDIMPEVWRGVREQYPNAELYLIGSGYPDFLDNTPGIKVCGFVEDLGDVLSKASVYIHPARADAFPVSVLEGLRAGLPAIVTSTTGTKSAVYSLDRNMMVERDVEEITNSILIYFAEPLSVRQNLSGKARKVGSQYNKESKQKQFRYRFEELVSEIRC